jgi:hypothetical protein
MPTREKTNLKYCKSYEKIIFIFFNIKFKIFSVLKVGERYKFRLATILREKKTIFHNFFCFKI